MALVKEQITIKGRDFIKNYSDQNFYIKRDEQLYAEAIDPIEFAEQRIYEETDIPIEPEEELKLVPDSDVESNDNEGGDQ